jgi:hypothetical protein
MNSRRARSYTRVTMSLQNLGPAKLLPREQAQIRHAADTLLFCADLRTDASAREAFGDIEVLFEHLVASGRWSDPRADELVDELWGCGPGPDALLELAA